MEQSSDETPRPQPGQRRRLLKGLLGVGISVPVVLTLQNSARAAFVSNQSCWDAIAAPADSRNEDRCQTTQDEWVRDQRQNFPNYATNSGACGATEELCPGTGATDLCLVYYNPTTGAAVNTDPKYGNDGTNKPITASCWSSFSNG